jgi:hypothetical protein
LSLVVAVAHPPKPLPDVERSDARSAQIGGPDRIVQRLQVSAYTSEPTPASLACNLLSKDDWRAALLDEPSKIRPEVTRIGLGKALSGRGKRLAGTRSGPDGAIIGPSRPPEREGPSADSCEEVAGGVSSNIGS